MDQARHVIGDLRPRDPVATTTALSLLSTLPLASDQCSDDDDVDDERSSHVDGDQCRRDANPDESLRCRHDRRPCPDRPYIIRAGCPPPPPPRSLLLEPARRPRRPPPPAEDEDSWMRVCRVTMSRRGAAYSHSGQ